MRRIFLLNLRFTLVILLVAGVLYPLVVTGLGQLLFPAQAGGSLIRNRQSQVIGSGLIAQGFTRPGYFHPRPSTNHYDAANSGGSNFGATSQKLFDRIKHDTMTYRKENPTVSYVQADAVTTSASGLDPDISLANALAQLPRVAEARKLSLPFVEQLVRTYTRDNRVNVLQVNLALDQQQQVSH